MNAEIDRRSGTAVWRQIAESLGREIAEGRWEEGQKLPTEASMSARFGVNRHTVRRAIGELGDRGLVRVEQGRGAFVRENVLEYLVGKRTRFTENVRRANRQPGGQCLHLDRERASRHIARILNISAGTAVLRLDSVGMLDERPLSLATHWFPARLFSDFRRVYDETLSITKVMEHHGFGDYQRAVTKVTARMPEAVDAELLKQPRARPILFVEAVNVSTQGDPIQYSNVRYAADRFQMVFESVDGASSYFEVD